MNRILNKKSIVELHTLSIVKEKERYIVGRPETEIYILIPKIGVEIIGYIKKHKRIGEIEKALKKRHGAVDIAGFVNELRAHGFVKKIDKKFISTKEPKFKIKDSVIGEKSRWLFSKPMQTFYLVILMMALAIIIMNPWYFPKSGDYFFTQYYILLFPLSFIVTWIFVLLHEMGHYLAARSLGINASFGISHRLYYLVATTRVTNLYSIDRKRRFRVLLGGMLVDVLIIGLGFILLFLSDSWIGFSPLLYKIIKFVILMQFLGFLWQFMFFMKTDIYYAFEHWISVYNLMQKTKQYLMSKIRKTFKPYFLKKEKNIVKLYSLFIVFGLVAVGAVFLLYSLPIIIELFVTSVGNILRGFVALNFSHFYDKLLFLLFFSINQSLLLYSVIKKHALAKKQGFYIAILMLFLITNYFVMFFSILLILVILNSAFLVYLFSLFLGILSCAILLNIISKLNRLSSFKIMPELFAAATAAIYGFFIFRFSNYFMITLAIPGKNSLIIGACYVVGIFLGYMYTYEIIHEKSYKRSIKRANDKGLLK